MVFAVLNPIFIKNITSGLNEPNDIIFIINNISYSTKDNIEPIKINFNDLETEIGKKVCSYSIVEKYKELEIKYGGLVEVNPGKSDAYIFLSNDGITCEFIFWKECEEMPVFVQNNFEIEYDFNDAKKTIPVTLNRLNTPDRANLILINCPTNIKFKKNNIPLFDLDKLSNKIYDFSRQSSFVICFHQNDYFDIEYRKIRLFEELNISEIYSKYFEKVEEIYKKIQIAINTKNNNNLDFIISELYDEDIFLINERKIIETKKILEKQLDKEEYLDFFYKVIIFCYAFKKKNSKNLGELIYKFDKNYNRIKNDKNIKIYEKILLLKNIYKCDNLETEETLNYYNINQIDKNSPLFIALDFLKSFIKDLDYNSTFYYPLMCLDSGTFNILYRKDKLYVLSTYGLNMYDIETIKNHLFNLLPNIVIISNSMDNDDYCKNYEGIGLITLNAKIFGNNLDKSIEDKNIRNNRSFILAYNLFHEIFGHNKSSFSKDLDIFESPVCFKDNIGHLRFLPYDNNDKIFLCLDEISYNDFPKLIQKGASGDSGYYLEYFFGKINNKYVMDIIDEIWEKTNLGILLDVDLWNKNNKIFREFLALKYEIIKESIDETQIDLDSDIIQQINQMKEMLFKKNNVNKDNIMLLENDKPIPFPRVRIRKKLIKKFNFFDEQKK